jgi:iron complex outermembrane receptor protein
MKFFAGFGVASRVPDGKELYYYNKLGKEIGNPDLDKVVNNEFDIGFDMQFEDATLKGKIFYSMLQDFIFYNATRNTFENRDSTIYGFELSGTYIATDALYFDYGLAYQRGEKDDPLIGQSGTNMPEIPPFKLNAAANYNWDDTLVFRAELVASSSWSDYDAENGEQELDGYGIVNLRGTKQWGDFEIIVGIDNVFDSTYAVSNTYKDLTLITGGGDVMPMNEPGRYVYTNLRYKF